MVSWIYANANHLAAPLAILIGITVLTGGLLILRGRKKGLEPPYTPVALKVFTGVLVIISCIFLGILLVHNYA